MKHLTTINIFEEQLGFSAGHFTIFSATERERLHGHTYRVSASIKANVNSHGIAFNYETYRDKIAAICQEINVYFLLPGASPFLRIEARENFYDVHFNGEVIPFLRSDTLILPVRNISLEEMAGWFVDRLWEDQDSIKAYGICEMTVCVSSGYGRSASMSYAL